MSKQTDSGGLDIDRRKYLSGSAAVGALTLGAGNAAAGDENDDTKKDDTKKDKEVTYITECPYVIKEPGYYKIAKELTVDDGACITIHASNVTLDGGNHLIKCDDGNNFNNTFPVVADNDDSVSAREESLEALDDWDGPDYFPFQSGTTGVLVRPKDDKKPGKKPEKNYLKNVTIKNLNVRYCDTGIAFYNTKNGRIKKVKAKQNYRGIYLFQSKKNTLYKNRAEKNWYGYHLLDSSSNVLKRNVAVNGYRGLCLDRLGTGSNRNVVYGTTASYNVSGVRMNGSYKNSLKKNRCTKNLSGIYVVGCKKNDLKHNKATKNLYNGIRMYDSYKNTLYQNDASKNIGTGVRLLESSSNTLKGNTASENHYSFGIRLTDSHSNTVSGNYANQNWFTNIHFGNSHKNTIKKNSVNGSRNHGIQLFRSHQNHISKNTAKKNGWYGYRLGQSKWNSGRGNTAKENDIGPVAISGGQGTNKIEVNGDWYGSQSGAASTDELQMVEVVDVDFFDQDSRTELVEVAERSAIDEAADLELADE